MKRIMALIDFSDVTPQVVKISRNMARAFNCELLLIHIIIPPSELNVAEAPADAPTESEANRLHHRQMEVLGLAIKKEGVNADTVIVQARSSRDTVAAKILEEITRLAPDLIVLGSHGHGRLHQLLAGSVTDTMIRKSPCPLLIVPSRK